MNKALLPLLTALYLLTQQAFAMDDLTSSMRVSAEGIRLQNERLKVISQNIANSGVASSDPNVNPYSRKLVTVKNAYSPTAGAEVVQIDKILRDKSNYILKYEPHHPGANADGFVKYPNVNMALETMDAREAQRAYEANLHAMDIAKSNQMRMIEALR